MGEFLLAPRAYLLLAYLLLAYLPNESVSLLSGALPNVAMND